MYQSFLWNASLTLAVAMMKWEHPAAAPPPQPYFKIFFGAQYFLGLTILTETPSRDVAECIGVTQMK
jgi:hypothetical protein